MGIRTANSRSDGCGNKELRTVGVFSRIGHAEYAGLGVLQFEVLVGELVPVDGFSASA